MNAAAELYECHGHLMMDGEDYRTAYRRHAGGVDISEVKGYLDALKSAGVRYYRDGGDALGVSAAAREIIADWGIEYATPIFAIHRKGRYGGIVGREYRDLAEYRTRIAEARAAGCDFIKVMFSGIITFRSFGELSCPSLDRDEIRSLVEIAHGEGFRVMAHVNGADTVRAAVDAGTDSIEHGYFMDDACLRALADSGSVWVPTIAAIEAFVGRAGFDPAVTAQVFAHQQDCIRRGAELGVKIACGSDAGAVGVPQGTGAATEYALLRTAGVSAESIARANEKLRKEFRAQE